MKSPNLLERFNQEIQRRTLVVRIFPDEASCPRWVRAVAAEQHEAWREGRRYLNAELLREQIQPLPMPTIKAAGCSTGGAASLGLAARRRLDVPSKLP